MQTRIILLVWSCQSETSNDNHGGCISEAGCLDGSAAPPVETQTGENGVGEVQAQSNKEVLTQLMFKCQEIPNEHGPDVNPIGAHCRNG